MGFATILHPTGGMKGADGAPPRRGEQTAMQASTRRLLVLFDAGQADVVQLFADALCQASVVVEAFDQCALHSDHAVIGLDNCAISPANLRAITKPDWTIITTHAVDVQDLRNEDVTECCDYEFIYTKKELTRRAVARFTEFILGKSQFHQRIMGLPSSNVLSLDVPDVRKVLANADIITIGVDAIELRVDMLVEPSPRGQPGGLAGMKYVGEQVMALRQATMLPIIFTTRSMRGGGRFPAHDHEVFHPYLRKAIQWGCEYIDVELWLPEVTRIAIANHRGLSKIISTHHDMSGGFSWNSSESYHLFEQCAMHSDVVKMEVMAEGNEDNEDLEAFRAVIESRYPKRPFCGANVSRAGRPLLTQNNKVLASHRHPMASSSANDLPGIAETNAALLALGCTREQELWAIGHNATAAIRTGFLEKCINEIGLAYQLRCTEDTSSSYLEAAEAAAMQQANFGGAWLNPPRELKSFRIASPSESAQQIGYADTMIATRAATRTGEAQLQVDNIAWRAILSTLTYDVLPCAFEGRHAIVIGDGEHMDTCLAAIYALRSLKVKVIHSVGFKPPAGPLASCVRYMGGVADMQEVQDPVVVLSVLSPGRANAAAPLLKFFCNGAQEPTRSVKLFVDLLQAKEPLGVTNERGQQLLALAVANELGWTVYGAEDVQCWTTVEMTKRLLNHDLGFDFVRRYS